MIFFRMESFGEAIRLIRQMLTIPGIRSFQESVFFSVGEEMPNAGDLRLLLAAAAAVLVCATAFALFDLRVYRRGWFMPAVTGAVTGVTGFRHISL